MGKIEVNYKSFDDFNIITGDGGVDTVSRHRLISTNLSDEELDTPLTYSVVNVPAILGYNCPMPENLKGIQEETITLKDLISDGYLEDDVISYLRKNHKLDIEYVDIEGKK